jgi:hypothetical protein
MTFTIESGITMPKRARGRAPTKFPMGDMAVGDSFLIPCDAADKKGMINWRRKFLVAKQAFLKQFEGEFKTATMPDGIRVWRTA